MEEGRPPPSMLGDLSPRDTDNTTRKFVSSMGAGLDEPASLDVIGDNQLDEQTQALLARMLSSEEEEDEALRPSSLSARAWLVTNISICFLYLAMGGMCIVGAVYFQG